MVKIYLCIKITCSRIYLNYIDGNLYYFHFSLSSRNLMDIWIFDPSKFFRIVSIFKVHNIYPKGKVDQFITWINKLKETNTYLPLNENVVFLGFLIHLSLTIPLSIYYHLQTETKKEKNKTFIPFYSLVNGWTAMLSLCFMYEPWPCYQYTVNVYPKMKTFCTDKKSKTILNTEQDL